MILLVSLVLLTTYPVGAEKLAHAPHKIFLCIISPDIDQNSMLTEAVLKNLLNIEAILGSYYLYASE